MTADMIITGIELVITVKDSSSLGDIDMDKATQEAVRKMEEGIDFALDDSVLRLYNEVEVHFRGE
jgi:hypothetical protein